MFKVEQTDEYGHHVNEWNFDTLHDCAVHITDQVKAGEGSADNYTIWQSVEFDVQITVNIVVG